MQLLTYDKLGFQMNGMPYRVAAGAMHYFRVPRPYWRDRLLKIKACGFTTVETYTAWNLHEPQEGVFDFTGNLDLDAYLSLIAEMGMTAIVRPGPYICSEWDFGGLPWWLLRYDDLELRCMNERYLEKVENYFRALLPIIARHQADCGGPVIMVQVENEYGSYGNDSAYIRCLADMLTAGGITCPLFTSDGPSEAMLSGGTVPEILKTVNFGSRADQAFKTLRRFQKEGPLMCAEFWAGWFDHWGEKHHRRSAEDAAKCLGEVLKANGSVSVYMMHGGTNFGWMNGANASDELYEPTINSYDDDAPINEYGGLTEKYAAVKAVMAQYGFESDAAVPPLPAPASYPEIVFDTAADLLTSLDRLSEPVNTVTPQPMEKLGQGYGFICYRTLIKGPKEKETLYFTPHDRAYVFQDGKFLGVVYRNDSKARIRLDVPAAGTELTILVENMGRANYGPLLRDQKGIVGGVRLGGQFLYHWRTWTLPLDNAENAAFSQPKKMKFDKRPQLLRGELVIEGEPRDTFVDTSLFKKGVIIVNGVVLSRYWEVGPQKTAYLPAPLLHEGANTVMLLELEGYKEPVLRFQDRPDIG